MGMGIGGFCWGSGGFLCGSGGFWWGSGSFWWVLLGSGGSLERLKLLEISLASLAALMQFVATARYRAGCGGAGHGLFAAAWMQDAKDRRRERKRDRAI
jgi:hypothetical protein